jgi:hypothetical protein
VGGEGRPAYDPRRASRGSSAVRRPSPRKLNDSTVKKISTPGMIATAGFSSRYW